MTDKDIGKIAREIAERGNTAEVKQNKDGIVILEVWKKIDQSVDTSSLLRRGNKLPMEELQRQSLEQRLKE